MNSTAVASFTAAARGAAASLPSMAPAIVIIGRMRLPPEAMRWPASCGISGTLLSIRSRIVMSTRSISAESIEISGTSDGAPSSDRAACEAVIF